MPGKREPPVPIRRQLEQLSRRLDALEQGLQPRRQSGEGGATEELAADDEAGGSLSISGSIRQGDRRFSFRQRADLADVLEADPEAVARVFAALGSPFRVRLLRLLIEGPQTSQRLQDGLRVGAVGQLYHHLKELLAAGLIGQRKRGVYAIREEIVMPVLMAFAVAPRLVSGGGAGDGRDRPAADG
jgi:DNA-binding transcriptional ArsR family regulator